MLLSNYDFYDIHAVFVAVRSMPDAEHNKDLLTIIDQVLLKENDDNFVESNLIRNELRNSGIVFGEAFSWIHVSNYYTYGSRVIKDKKIYLLLSRIVEKMIRSVDDNDFEKLADLADAAHNVPIFAADGCKDMRKALKIQFKYYNKKYNENLWDELQQ